MFSAQLHLTGPFTSALTVRPSSVNLQMNRGGFAGFPHILIMDAPTGQSSFRMSSRTLLLSKSDSVDVSQNDSGFFSLHSHQSATSNVSTCANSKSMSALRCRMNKIRVHLESRVLKYGHHFLLCLMQKSCPILAVALLRSRTPCLFGWTKAVEERNRAKTSAPHPSLSTLNRRSRWCLRP